MTTMGYLREIKSIRRLAQTGDINAWPQDSQHKQKALTLKLLSFFTRNKNDFYKAAKIAKIK